MESSRVSDRVGQAALLAGVMITLWFILVPRAPSNPRNKSSVPDSPQSRRPVPDAPQSRPTKKVGLHQVYPLPEEEIKTDFDIIAIHGLDTKSPDTWLWDPKGARVNWLADRHMLPARFQTARIFTCDWPADLLVQSGFVQKPIEAYARSLLASINSRPPVTDTTPGNDDRPILFIASCLGGIILMKALDIASHEYLSVKTATRGIIFLATPFRGTSFQNVADWAEPGLRMWASAQNKNVSRLLENVKETPGHKELVRRFTRLCQDHNLTGSVFNFYETGKTSLPRKIFPWLPASLSKCTQLVDEQSATLDFVQHPLPLDRPHVLMNKFSGPDDDGYRSVCGLVDVVVCKIRNGRPLEKADLRIQNTCYSLKNLQIERLSGDLLPMDRCYINLAIVEHTGENAQKNTAQKASPFSLFARLRVEAPESTEIALSSLFKPRKTQDGRVRQPSRILIRGRAGVGKTTLCKKIVYEFSHGEKWQQWRELYDRVLWVPLRNLKREERRRIAGYNMADLFRHEYFSHLNDTALADEWCQTLCQTLEKGQSGRTLFILDGLDEVSQDLDGDMLSFFKHLLNQPHAIITSRPHAKIPPNVDPMHLELETIGFFSEQVEAYVEKAFSNPETGTTDSKRPAEILSYLREHPLVEGLVRIPIQLDALCYSWDSFDRSVGESAPETMTAIYKAIEESLWKKDIVRLEKENKRKPLTSAQIQNEHLDDLDGFIKDEIRFLEGIAFTGLQHDVIDFTPQHRRAVCEHFKVSGILPNMTLPRLSFLRTSDTSSNEPNYHFLHLTFQEYFAARYFARQWREAQPLTCISLGNAENKGGSCVPADFLQKHKYNTRYNIMWRFVAGSLEGQAADNFFQAIEDQPRDCLGPTHQRLIMHCLSEASPEMASRRTLEETLSKWLIFECKFVPYYPQLVAETECPKLTLETAVRSAPTDAKFSLLHSLERRPTKPSFVLDLSISFLEDEDASIRVAALKALQHQTSLSPETLQALTTRLNDEHWRVRDAAVKALQNQTSLSPETLQALTARIEDEYRGVREAAAKILQNQTSLSPETLQALTARLENKDEDVRKAAAKALQNQPSLSPETLQALTARIEDEFEYWGVRDAAAKALQNQTSLSPETLQALTARLENKDEDVRKAAAKALQNQPSLGPETLQALTALLEDEYWDVREAAAEALQNQPSLGPETLQALTALLEDEVWDVREAAAEALQSQTSLGPKTIQAATKQNKDEDEDESQTLQAIVAQLENEDWRIKRNAINMLQRQTSLGPEILQAIVARLEDKDKEVRSTAVDVLGRQTPLDPEILQATAARLEDEDRDVRKAAVDVLKRQTPLDLEIQQALAARLEDKDGDIRKAAVDVLGRQTPLDPEILQALTARLEDEDRDVRKAAVDVLKRQTPLDLEIQQALTARLEDKDCDIRRAAVDVLQRQTSLGPEILQAIMARLEDLIGTVRSIAVDALKRQTPLDPETLQAIAARLKDENEGIRRTAVDALISQPELDLNNFVQYSEAFYRELLRKSFKQPLSLSVIGSCFIMTVDGKEVIWPCKQGQFTEAIEKAQQDLEDCGARA